MTGNENRPASHVTAGIVPGRGVNDATEDQWHQIVPVCWFCGGFVPITEGMVRLATRTLWICHECRRNPACAVPGGQVARDADRVEAAAIADLLALHDHLGA